MPFEVSGGVGGGAALGGQLFLFPNPAGLDDVISVMEIVFSLWLSYDIFGTLEMHFFLLLIFDDYNYGTAT